jgi:hypothetical protein
MRFVKSPASTKATSKSKVVKPVAWVIGEDGKSLAGVDEDGFIDGKIVAPGRIEIFYRHLNANESVVAAGTYTRQK